jgi:hypothetical protein
VESTIITSIANQFEKGQKPRQPQFSCAGAVGLRGRLGRRQGTHCEGYCNTMLSAPWTALMPAPGDGHIHEEQARGMRVEGSCIALVVA